MNRKFLSGFLAVLLVATMMLGCFVTVNAEEVTAPSVSLSYSVSKSGNTVTANINLTSTSVPLQGIKFDLSFDNTKLSYDYDASKTASSSAILPWASTTAAKANENGVVKVTCIDTVDTTTSTGLVASLVFNVLDSAVGSSTLTLSGYAASDPDNNKIVPTLNATSQTLTVAGYNVTVNEATNGTVTASASKVYPGETVTLTTKADSGYMIDSVTVTDESGAAVSVTSSGDTHTFTMPSSSVTVSAAFRPKDFMISKGTVSAGGTLTLDPTTSKAGQTITVTATPSNGYEIDKVTATDTSGAAVTLSGSDGSYTFTMPADDVTVNASFKAKIYTITKGTVSEGGSLTVGSSAAFNSNVDITLAPATGYAVNSVTVTDASGASVKVTGSGNKYSFTMPASNVTVNASFKKVDYTITKGSITGGKLEISASKANYEDTVTITATPDTGYELTSVSVPGVTLKDEGNGKFSFKMPAQNVTVNATFTGKTFSIKTSAKNGTISVNANAAYNSTVNVTVAPDTGYAVDSVTVTDASGASVKVTGSNNKYTFTMPASNVTVTASFKEVDYTITKGSVTGGKLEISATKANYEDTITITAIPDAGYEVSSVTVPGVTVKEERNDKFSFKMPAQDVTVNATFSVKTFNIKTSAKNGTINVNANAAYNSTVNVTVAPATGYKLVSVSGKDANGNAVALTGSGSSYSFKMPAGNVTITAEFEKASYSVTLNYNANQGSASVNKSTVNYGDKVTIKASAKEGYKINYVTVTDANGSSVKVSGSKGNYSFEMPASNVKVSVAFIGDAFSITTATVANGTITAPTSGAQSSTVTFTAVPNTGYKTTFVKVVDANGKEIATTAGADNSYSFTMPSAKVTISAEFEIVVYNVTSNPAENGSFTVDAQTATYDTKVNVTVAANDGYQFNALTVTDAEGNLVSFTGGNNVYTFAMPASDVTVAVTFEEIPTITYKATVVETPNGTVALSKYDAGAGSTVTISATPNEGYQVAAVEVLTADGKLIATTGNLNVSNFEMPESDVTIKVTFEKAPEPTVPEQPTDPTTPGNTSNVSVLFWILPIIALLVVAAIVVIILILKKKKD